MRIPFILATLVVALVAASAPSAETTLTVKAGDQPCPVAILTAPLPAELVDRPLELTLAGSSDLIPVQADQSGGQPSATFILEDLKAGEERTLILKEGGRLRPGEIPAAVSAVVPTLEGASPVGVEIRVSEAGAAVWIDGKFFTMYQTAFGPKPYLWPIVGPHDVPMTRAFPMDKVKGELRDHHHHRGMWFTFDRVNGNDFWSETPTSAVSQHLEFTEIVSGPVFGEFTSRVAWQSRKAEPVAEDLRTYRFYRVPGAQVIDVSLSMKSAAGPLEFGDSKEGLFAIRVNEWMKVDRKDGPGHILNSAGDVDGAAWGKRATWVDYYGEVDGHPLGVAMFDAPTNFRHPTYWHVRTYGLFAANPFGISHFTGDKSQDGSYTVPEGESFQAAYRVLFHTGGPEDAHVADWYSAFATPPSVTVSGTR